MLMLAQTVFAMEQQDVEHISFTNRLGNTFEMIPLHELGDTAIIGLYNLFQEEDVSKYYERGAKKSLEDCRGIYNRVSPRFQNWNRNVLGWMGIVDSDKIFKGFIGAHIDTKTEPYSVEVAIALATDVQHTKLATNGLMEYFSYFWPKLNSEISSRVRSIKSPLNPRNEASIGLCEFFFEGSVDKASCYVPSYYTAIPKEKGERINSTIPIEVVIKKVREYEELKRQ
jgi:hypothetical protein